MPLVADAPCSQAPGELAGSEGGLRDPAGSRVSTRVDRFDAQDRPLVEWALCAGTGSMLPPGPLGRGTGVDRIGSYDERLPRLRDEQVVDCELPWGQSLVVGVAEEDLEDGAVGFDAVGPVVAPQERTGAP